MQNAHERFGTLEFIKRTKDTTTRVRVYIDRVVLETAKDERGQAAAHLVSIIGGDAEIGALWAAVTEGALFHIQLPGGTPIAASLGLFLAKTLQDPESTMMVDRLIATAPTLIGRSNAQRTRRPPAIGMATKL